MAEELVVNTDSMSAEFELSGVTSNFVTKAGSNAVHGAFTGRYANTALQSENLSDDLIARGLTSGNRIEKIWDANPSVGGPLIKDRVWLFSSFRHWGTYNYIAGLYDDLDPTALVYTPDLSRPAIHPVWHVNGDARLTFRATPRNKINAYYHYQYTDFGTCLRPTLLTAPSGCAHNKNDPQWFAQASWSSPLTNRAVDSRRAERSRSRTRPAAGIRACPTISRRSRNRPRGFTCRAPTAGFGGTPQPPVELSRRGVVRDRHARRQGRAHPHAHMACHRQRSQQRGELHLLQRRAAAGSRNSPSPPHSPNA